MDTTGEVVLLNVDSTHNATGFLLADLARHPDIQDKVLQELDTVLGGRSLSEFRGGGGGPGVDTPSLPLGHTYL